MGCLLWLSGSKLSYGLINKRVSISPICQRQLKKAEAIHKLAYVSPKPLQSKDKIFMCDCFLSDNKPLSDCKHTLNQFLLTHKYFTSAFFSPSQRHSSERFRLSWVMLGRWVGNFLFFQSDKRF